MTFRLGTRKLVDATIVRRRNRPRPVDQVEPLAGHFARAFDHHVMNVSPARREEVWPREKGALLCSAMSFDTSLVSISRRTRLASHADGHRRIASRRPLVSLLYLRWTQIHRTGSSPSANRLLLSNVKVGRQATGSNKKLNLVAVLVALLLPASRLFHIYFSIS